MAPGDIGPPLFGDAAQVPDSLPTHMARGTPLWRVLYMVAILLVCVSAVGVAYALPARPATPPAVPSPTSGQQLPNYLPAPTHDARATATPAPAGRGGGPAPTAKPQPSPMPSPTATSLPVPTSTGGGGGG